MPTPLRRPSESLSRVALLFALTLAVLEVVCAGGTHPLRTGAGRCVMRCALRYVVFVGRGWCMIEGRLTMWAVETVAEVCSV